jgi:DNA-binding PadR family transcriptional regulator
MADVRLKGNLRMLLLAAAEGSPAHGYELIRRLHRSSNGHFDLQDGAVYPVLHGLERDRLLSAQWTEVEGRRRKVYRVTRTGRKHLKGERESWRHFASAVELVMGGS